MRKLRLRPVAGTCPGSHTRAARIPSPVWKAERFPPHCPRQPKLLRERSNSNPQSAAPGRRGVVLISDSLSASRGGRPTGEGIGAGAAGGPGAGSPGLAVRFLWRRGPAPRQALCSAARPGRLPGPTCLRLDARLPFPAGSRGGARQPAVPGARAPLPLRCALPGSLTPGGPRWGQKSSPAPRRRPPTARPPAGR